MVGKTEGEGGARAKVRARMSERKRHRKRSRKRKIRRNRRSLQQTRPTRCDLLYSHFLEFFYLVIVCRKTRNLHHKNKISVSGHPINGGQLL